MNRRHLLRAVSGMAGGIWLVPGAASGRQDPPAPEARREPRPVPDEAKIRVLELPSPADAATLSADGSLVAAGGNDGIVRLWDAVSGRALAAFQGHDFRIEAITLSPDRRRIALKGPKWAGFVEGGLSSPFLEMGGVIKVWDIAAERLLDNFPLKDEDRPGWMAFSPDGKLLLILSRTGLTIRNIEPGPDDAWRMREVGEKEKDDWSCGGKASFSADAQRAVATCGRRAPRGSAPALRLWDVPTQRIRTLEHLQDQIGGSFGPIALSGDGKLIAITTVGVPLASLRDVSDENRQPRADEPPRYPTTEPRKQERLVTVLDFDSGKVVSQLRPRPESIPHLYYLAFSPDGSWIVTVDDDSPPKGQNEILRLWHARTGHELRAYRGPRGHVREVAFLPDGRLRVVSGGDVLTEKGQRVGTDPLKVWEAALPVP